MESSKQKSPATYRTISGYWLIIGAAVLWGTTGTAQAFTPIGFDPKIIGTLRLLIGGLALLLLAIKRKELGHYRDWKLCPVLLAAAFTSSFQLCFFAAVAKTGVAVGTIIGIGSAPIAGGLLGLIFRGENPGPRWLMATVLAIIGCTLLSFSGGDVNVDPIGVLLALAAGFSYAAYTLVIKGLLEKHSPIGSMAVVVCLGAAILSPLLIDIDPDWILQPRTIGIVLYIGLATMALSYFLFAKGLQSVPVATAVTLSLAEPMTAALMGIIVLGEQLDTQAFYGIGLIFAGLFVLMARRQNKL